MTPDGVWLAYTADTRGDEAFTVYVQKANTGARSAVTLPDVPAAASLAWAADNRTLFFLSQAPAHQTTDVHSSGNLVLFRKGLCQPALLFGAPQAPSDSHCCRPVVLRCM